MNERSLNGISLRQLRAFVSVTEQGSFTAAARDLHLTQSAVSVLIRDLERELGLRLLDRTTRSVKLTESGAELLSPARQMLVDLQAAVLSSRALADKKRGRVRVAASPLFSSLFLPKAILEFHTHFPAVDVVVCDTPAGLIGKLVADGKVDFGISATIKHDAMLTADLLMVDEAVLVCPPGHPLTRRRNIKWQDLTKYPFIAVSPESGTRQIVDDCVTTVGVTLTPTYEVASVWTLLGMVGAGLGIGITTGMVRMLTPLYEVCICRIQRRKIERPIMLLRHRRRSLSPAAESFIKFLPRM